MARLKKKESQLEPGTYPEIPGKDEMVSSQFIRQCLRLNELGNGVLFSVLLRGKFAFSSSKNCWMRWTGHSWEYDKLGALAEVEEVVDCLRGEVARIETEIRSASDKDSQGKEILEKLRLDIYRRINHLRTSRGATACLTFARTCKEPLCIRNDEINKNRWV